MIRPVRMMVLIKGLHHPIVRPHPGIWPVPALRVERFVTSCKPKGRAYSAKGLFGPFFMDARIEIEAFDRKLCVSGLKCSPLRLVRVFFLFF